MSRSIVYEFQTILERATDESLIYAIIYFSICKSRLFNPLSANPIKWSNTVKQFVDCSRLIFRVCLTFFRVWHWKGYEYYLIWLPILIRPITLLIRPIFYQKSWDVSEINLQFSIIHFRFHLIYIRATQKDISSVKSMKNIN